MLTHPKTQTREEREAAAVCVELSDYLTAERVQLLDALKEGDVDSIRALTNIDWNFVYPPAIVNATTGERSLEAWCRSPLCLLVRPDEGNFQRKMAGIDEDERQELIEDVLASGCADPNFPPIYWANPALHACFEGDVAALDALRQAGCDLRQRVEWLLQEAPEFSLVHAAAYNGQVEVLRYLRQYMPPSFFRITDAEGSNPLHTLLESSRDMATARFLLDVGVGEHCSPSSRPAPKPSLSPTSLAPTSLSPNPLSPQPLSPKPSLAPTSFAQTSLSPQPLSRPILSLVSDCYGHRRPFRTRDCHSQHLSPQPLSLSLHRIRHLPSHISTPSIRLPPPPDGFAINKLGRSPLSMAIEDLPELALELLSSK